MRSVLALTPGIGVLLFVIAIGTCGCATGTSTMAASTHAKSSLYRSASATVRLTPEHTFEPAVTLLLERDDIEITVLTEADNRCQAIAGSRKLTLRVIKVDDERSRLSLLVGSGDDPEANQELAEILIQDICARLEAACERGAGAL
jgi:hypothetical protein